MGVGRRRGARAAPGAYLCRWASRGRSKASVTSAAEPRILTAAVESDLSAPSSLRPRLARGRHQVAGDGLFEVEVFLPTPFATQSVIRAAVLREVISADALAAIPGAHHRL